MKYLVCFQTFLFLYWMGQGSASFEPVCSIETVNQVALAVGNDLLTIALGPAIRMGQYRGIILNSWANGWSQATPQQISSFLVPVLSTPSLDNGTLGQVFYNTLDPSTWPSSFAVVDLNPVRQTNFLFGRYALNGTQAWNMSCLVQKFIAGLINTASLSSPAMYSCLEQINFTRACQQYPRRCDSFQKSLPSAIQTAELAWRWSSPLEWLLPQFTAEFPQATLIYTDDWGTIRTSQASVLADDCRNNYPSLAFLCGNYTLVSEYGTDLAASPGILLPFYVAYSQARGVNPTVTLSNYPWWNPPVFNARSAEVFSVYFAGPPGEIMLVSELPIQDPTIGLTATISISMLTSTLAYRQMLDAVLFNTAGIDMASTTPPWFYFMADEHGLIDMTPSMSANVFMCSTVAAQQRIQNGTNSFMCTNQAQHRDYMTNQFTRIWSVSQSEFPAIRNLASVFRLATSVEYATTSVSVNAILTTQNAIPFSSVVQTVVLDSTPYILSIYGYAIRPYLAWWVVVGVPSESIFSQVQWSFINPLYGSPTSPVVYFRPDDPDESQWFTLMLNNTGSFPIPFVFVSAFLGEGLQVSPLQTSLPAGQTLSILFNFTNELLNTLLDSNLPFTFVPLPSSGGLCVQPLASSVSVTWRWIYQIHSVDSVLQNMMWILMSSTVCVILLLLYKILCFGEETKERKQTFAWIQLHLLCLCSTALFFITNADSDALCRVRAWTLAVGGTGMMIPFCLYMGCIRFDYIHHRTSKSNIRFLLWTFVLEVLSVFIFVFPIELTNLSSNLIVLSALTDANQRIYGQFYQCEQYEWILGTASVCIGALCVVGGILAWRLRSVPGMFQIAIKGVLWCLFGIAFGSSLLSLQFLLQDPRVVATLRCLGCLGTVWFFLLLFQTSFFDSFLEIHSLEFQETRLPKPSLRPFPKSSQEEKKEVVVESVPSPSKIVVPFGKTHVPGNVVPEEFDL